MTARSRLLRMSGRPSIPWRRAAECLDQEVHHDAHPRANVTAAWIDSQHVNLRHAIAGQQTNQSAAAQIVADR